jgi:hypothetical protein
LAGAMRSRVVQGSVLVLDELDEAFAVGAHLALDFGQSGKVFPLARRSCSGGMLGGIRRQVNESGVVGGAGGRGLAINRDNAQTPSMSAIDACFRQPSPM